MTSTHPHQGGCPPGTPDAYIAGTVNADCWHLVMRQLAAQLKRHDIHPAEAVVLVPYAQLIAQARRAWVALSSQDSTDPLSSFMPRFETTMNWVTTLGARAGFFEPMGDDMRMDVAFDSLTAASLLERSGLGSEPDAMVGRLLEAAWSLSRVAAAQAPDARAAWGLRIASQFMDDTHAPVLALEIAIGRIAVAWAAHSAYATDRLFGVKPRFLASIGGFQLDPLATALMHYHGGPGISMALATPVEAPMPPLPITFRPGLHRAADAEDEAEMAAACVLRHLAAGRSPVALVAQDRSLTRRIGAMLAQRGVALRDETGWKLSTTRAAANMMGLLRAAAWNASTDTVLDWLKNAPAFAEPLVTAAEVELRRMRNRTWRELPDFAAGSGEGWGRDASSANATRNEVPKHRYLPDLAQRVNDMRASMARARPLSTWLADVRDALSAAGQWDGFAQDAAGRAVLDALRLHEGAEADLAHGPVMDLAGLTRWIYRALEAGSYTPDHPVHEQVVILPLAQLLGRALPAVVLAGCDEVHLPASPEPPGAWSPKQRGLLGLPSREDLAHMIYQAWYYALQCSHVDLLWRTSSNGEPVMPSGLVQALLLDHPAVQTSDTRDYREVLLSATTRPRPAGSQLPVSRLSASAYEDLRRCPYRFFALRQLRLQTADELEADIDKRDFGNWLHITLSRFHETLKNVELDADTSDASKAAHRVTLMNQACEQAFQSMGLSAAEFLPFAASWPRVRDGYLTWLRTHETGGARFEVSEVDKELPLGQLGATTSGAGLTLVGTLDRVDTVAPHHGNTGEFTLPRTTLVIDYKTEPYTVTSERIKANSEDTQLAFYAALMSDDTLRAAYVNLGEKSPTKTYEQLHIVNLRDGLIHSIRRDMANIAGGAAMPALGEGNVCDHCSARGLCRKDFWSQ